MGLQEFAIIYNPYTQNTLGFIAHNSSHTALTIENFENNDTRYFVPYTDSLEHLFQSIALQNTTENSTKKADYIGYVESILQQIYLRHFQKIVAAQVKVFDISLSPSIVFNKFNQLKKTFPQAFVYCYYIDQSIWLGASPELIGKTSDKIFHTISLAGTRTSGREDFTLKEIHEQQLVSNHIQAVLKSYSQTVINPTSDTTHFGNIRHIMSQYTIPLDERLGFDTLIHEIHPSPALAGIPTQEAIQFIHSNEPITRLWYTGVSSFEDSGEHYAFAHIRCARITANQAIFYAGAGIVEGSQPESEWEETNQKIETIKTVILSL